MADFHSPRPDRERAPGAGPCPFVLGFRRQAARERFGRPRSPALLPLDAPAGTLIPLKIPVPLRMRTFILFVVLLAASLILAAAITYPAWLLVGTISVEPVHRVMNRVAMLIALIGLVLLTHRLGLANRAAMGYGLPRREFMRQLAIGWLGGFMLMVPLVGLLLGLEVRTLKTGFAQTLPALIAGGIVSGLIVALIEETFFRGILFTALSPGGNTGESPGDRYAVPLRASSAIALKSWQPRGVYQPTSDMPSRSGSLSAVNPKARQTKTLSGTAQPRVIFEQDGFEQSSTRSANAAARRSGIAAAILAPSLLYAFLHFLGGKLRIPNDEVSWFHGFTVLGRLFEHYADPLAFIDSFLALTMLGILLALVRWRTGAIAACIGLHAAGVCVIAVLRASTTLGETHFSAIVGSYDGVIGWAALAWFALIALAVALTRPRAARSWRLPTDQ